MVGRGWGGARGKWEIDIKTHIEEIRKKKLLTGYVAEYDEREERGEEKPLNVFIGP